LKPPPDPIPFKTHPFDPCSSPAITLRGMFLFNFSGRIVETAIPYENGDDSHRFRARGELFSSIHECYDASVKGNFPGYL
jgi:hypothetical protein